MKRIAFSLAVSLCLLVVVSQHTTVAAKDTWVSVRTKNFLMLGNASEKDIRRVALKLEQFREAFTNLFPNIRFNTPVPTTVIVFKSDSSFGPFKPGPNIAGYFQSGQDVNYITLTTEVRGQQDPFSVIFHEYTHLLINNTFPRAPVWFNEGLAEYYSTFSITDDQKVVMGTPIASHVYRLRESQMLPLKTLFEVDQTSPHYNERNKQTIFYAQSWALVHYMIIGKKVGGQAEQLGKFLMLVDAKTPMDQAFKQAFGVPFETMEKDLRNYVNGNRYYSLTGHFERKLEIDTSTEAIPLTDAEVQAYLGDLLLHSHRTDAYTYLERAVKLDPNLAMANASLGMAYFREGKVNEALASLERAVAANSQNYLAHYYYAFTLSRSGPGGGPTVAGYPADIAAKIREHLEKAIALRPDYPESYSLLAFISLVTGKGIDESLASLKKISASFPGRHDLTLMLAQLYLEKGERKLAREMLEQVVKLSTDQQVRQDAASLLSDISSFEKATEKAAEDEKQSAHAVADENQVVIQPNDKPSTPPPDPSSYLREALRQPKAGETQLQGTLVRIECDAKGMVFVVQTGATLLRLRASSLGNMELTTYDPSIKGDISCGERKPANAVVIAYLANADAKLKVDGVLKSIEFVPSDFKLKP